MEIDNNTQKKIFATNLRRLLDGESQKQVADKLGVSTQTFNTWYNGKAMPRMGMIQELATLFNVGLSELLNPYIEDTQKREIDEIMIAYQRADDVTKEMVKRILKIE